MKKRKVAIFCHNLYAGDILWGFTEAGHEAHIIAPTSIESFETIMELLNPDLLILSSSMDYFQDFMLRHIGARNTSSYQCVCWDTEGIGQFRLQMSAFECIKPDMVFSICPEMMEWLKIKNIPSERLDFAYNPTIHYPKGDFESKNETISLVGNGWLWYANTYPMHFRYSNALPILLKPIIENNYTINFYGTTDYKPVIKKFLDLDVPIEWFKGTISYESTCDIYHNSFVNLITQNHDKTITRRTFEILGSGGFGLSCYNTALNELFGTSGALAISSSPSETLDILEHYKNNPDEYAKVRKTAVKSVQNHTYKERAEQMIRKLFTIN